MPAGRAARPESQRTQRQVVVVDVVDERLQQRQEESLRGLPEVVVLLGRQADDRRGIHRVAPVRHRVHLDDRLVYRKGLRKAVSSSPTNVPPHVQAVRKS